MKYKKTWNNNHENIRDIVEIILQSQSRFISDKKKMESTLFGKIITPMKIP